MHLAEQQKNLGMFSRMTRLATSAKPASAAADTSSAVSDNHFALFSFKSVSHPVSYFVLKSSAERDKFC